MAVLWAVVIASGQAALVSPCVRTTGHGVLRALDRRVQGGGVLVLFRENVI